MSAHKYGVTIVGVPLDNTTMHSALEQICSYIEQGGFHQIATANVNFLANSLRIPELRRALGTCDMVVPDGVPLLWISKYLGLPLQERVTGVDMLPQLARLSAERGYTIYLLGAVESSSYAAVRTLEAQYPGVKIVGRHCPPMQPLDQMDNEDILRRIRAAKPDILLVAFGNPKQEMWLARNRGRLEVPVCMGIGGSLNMISGIVPRSPEFFQSRGIEWLYRASREPNRLVGRYASDFLTVLPALFRQFMALWLEGKHEPLISIRAEQLPGATVLHFTGGLFGCDLADLEEAINSNLRPHRHLVLDLSGVSAIGGDVLTMFIRLAASLQARRSGLWLTGPRPSSFRMLHACRITDLIQVCPTQADALERIAAIGQQGHYDEHEAIATLHAKALVP